MKFLIVGLGSMGKRRIRNVQHLDAGAVVGVDPRADRRAETAEKYRVPVYETFEHGMAHAPDAVIISTPPALHLPFARAAAEAGKHFFTEVGVGTADVEVLMALTQDRPLVAAPSCTLRFHPLLREVKQVIDSGAVGQIVAFSSHAGQYLPDWHPWEDYRNFWVSNRATGACQEQFVLDAIWLTWLLGPIRSVACFKDKRTSLDTAIDDVYQILVRMGDNVMGHMMCDVVSRSPYRGGRFFGEQGVIECSLTEKTVRIFTAADQQWRTVTQEHAHTEAGYIHAEHMYIEEMAQFVRAIRGEEPWSFSLRDEWQIQHALASADRSSDTGVHVTIDPDQQEAPWRQATQLPLKQTAR